MTTPAITPSLPDISKITSASTDAEISAAEAAVRATAIPGDNAGQPITVPSTTVVSNVNTSEPAVVPAQYTLTDLGNGQQELKLATGEVFKGTVTEVLEKVAKSKVDTTEYAKGLKAELETAKAAPVAPAAPALPANVTIHTNETEAAANVALQQKYLGAIGEGRIGDATLLSLAQSLKSTPEQVATYLEYIPTLIERDQRAQQREVLTGFIAENPGFPGDTPAAQALEQAMGNDALTVANLSKAYALCVMRGTIKPTPTSAAATNTTVTPRGTPPPMIPNTTPTNPMPKDPMAMNASNSTEAEIDQMMRDLRAGKV
jgi:hypothetical protein